MSQSHLDALRALLERVAPDPDARNAIECKHFFGGAAAYVNHRIFMTLTKAGLALKLPAESRAALMKRGARPLRYFTNAPVTNQSLV